MVLRWCDTLASAAEREMAPIGVGAGFFGGLSDAVSGAVGLDSSSGVVGGGRQMMHPIRHFSRYAR